MYQPNHPNKDPFDQLLTESLQQHSEPVRPGFTDKVLHQIDHFEEQKLLKRVVLQARLVLASCIVFSLCSLATLIFYIKDIGNVLIQGLNTAAQTPVSFSLNWQWVLIVTVVVSSVIYTSYESLGLRRLIANKLPG